MHDRDGRLSHKWFKGQKSKAVGFISSNKQPQEHLLRPQRLRKLHISNDVTTNILFRLSQWPGESGYHKR